MKEVRINMNQRVAYASHPDCFYDIASPEKHNMSLPIIILIHGGYWRNEFTHETLWPLQKELTKKGFIACNIEYRRGLESPWPLPSLDVKKAIENIKSEFKNREIVLIGHSVGGQLALLNASLADKVIALAPVTDLIYSRKHTLGNNAVNEYFGDSASMELLSAASPINHLPLRCSSCLIVHGANDQRVHLDTSIQFFKKNLTEKGNTDFLILDNMPHGEIIQPKKEHFSYIFQWLS